MTRRATARRQGANMKTVNFERNAGVGNIVLANPPKNLLDRRFSECLWQSIHEASESDIRVLLVTSEGQF